MRRVPFRKPTLTVSMFPFLAVLVCTMGALIVLLVTVVQKAKFDVESSAAEQASVASDADEELDAEKDVHVWRREVLEKQRDELKQKVAGQRLTLSHLEDHIRRLESRWRELTVQAKELQQLDQSKQQESVATVDKVEQLKRELAEARKSMEEVKEKVSKRPPTFAIVPYEGPNGTKRRPIYIECTDEGIVLQPSGIVLRPQDFEDSMGPGNPLDAALRTTREYLAKQGDTAVNGEPYPLLIVRPNGTVAYAVARAAIKSWDDEFGYELVDDEMRLAFPQSDPTLRVELEKSIADARAWQTILASAMPGRFKRGGGGGGGGGGLVATTAGGFRSTGGREGSTATGDSFTGGRFSGGGGTIAAGGGAIGHSGTGTGRNGPGGTGTGGTGPGADGTEGSAAGGDAASAGANGSSASGGVSSFSTAFRQPGGVPAGASAQSMSTSAASASSPARKLKGETYTPGLTAADAQAGSQPPRLGEPVQRHRSGQSGVSGGTAGPGGGKGRKAPLGTQPLAASRGENWGLPNRNQMSTGYTRYIQVECRADHLQVLPEKGDYRPPTIVRMPGETAESIDDFVSALWKRMESWGIASEGGYWKPIIRVQVAAGAEQRYQELCSLLDGSGLVIERK